MFRRNDPGSVFDAIQSDIYDAMIGVGEAVADEWRFRVAVPVEYRQTASGMIIPIRSLPHEPPRRETGELQEGIFTEIETDVHVVTLTIGNDVLHAFFTDGGTVKMAPRPHAPDIDNTTERLLDAIAGAI